ncbi:MAG: hypothetical protein UT32_C0020G0004 [Parcubacteria group bacterium GW2011_GWC2_39_14]|nr:MAG: hypothetical protein UT32_C0020G0004 [Parcubacteria group bacterium GW2011_GWC2_39_14]KKR54117.1 MAG: hypothetical protein UT91_C0020G0004 [Parcubacteria group bacterium GW2011_GWA2_40_23]
MGKLLEFPGVERGLSPEEMSVGMRVALPDGQARGEITEITETSLSVKLDGTNPEYPASTWQWENAPRFIQEK